MVNCILLIDDNINDNYYHIVTIRDAGVAQQIKTAGNGLKALDYLKKGRDDPDHYPFPDLIFLDIKMPGMDGFDFLNKFKETLVLGSPKPIIIIMTNSLNLNDEAMANDNYSTQISAFVNKPLTTDMVRNIIARFFPADHDRPH